MFCLDKYTKGILAKQSTTRKGKAGGVVIVAIYLPTKPHTHNPVSNGGVFLFAVHTPSHTFRCRGK